MSPRRSRSALTAPCSTFANILEKVPDSVVLLLPAVYLLIAQQMESCCGRERLTKSLCSLPQGTTAPPWEQPPSEQHKAAASVTFAFPCRFTDRPTPFRKSKKPLKSFTIALRSDLFKICWRRALRRHS